MSMEEDIATKCTQTFLHPKLHFPCAVLSCAHLMLPTCLKKYTTDWWSNHWRATFCHNANLRKLLKIDRATVVMWTAVSGAEIKYKKQKQTIKNPQKTQLKKSTTTKKRRRFEERQRSHLHSLHCWYNKSMVRFICTTCSERISSYSKQRKTLLTSVHEEYINF